VVICLEQDADLHMAQLMPLPLTVSCFSKIHIGFTFLVPAKLGNPRLGLLNVCVCVDYTLNILQHFVDVLLVWLLTSVCIVSLFVGHTELFSVLSYTVWLKLTMCLLLCNSLCY